MGKISSAAALLIICALFIQSNPAFAIDPIPTTSGLSGFVSLGGAYNNVESNTIAGNDLGDVANESISSLTDSPESKSSGNPIFNFELNYTFASTRTQLFLGNQLENLLRYDLATLAGVRHDLGDPGLMEPVSDDSLL